jgi:membrane protease YdiL (CAAX protease family)
MTTEPEAAGTALPADHPIQLEAEPSGIRKVFIGPDGIRAIWRFLLYVLMFVAISSTLLALLRLSPAIRQIFVDAQKDGGIISHAFNFLFELTMILAAFIPAVVMNHFEKRPFGAYGIPLKGAFGRLFWQGILWGLIFESAEVCLISTFGGFSFGTLALSGPEIIKHGILWAIGFLLVGFFEEFLFRGYTQFTLGSWIGFWPSAFVLSALFGLTHLSNSGEGWVGALSVFSFAMFACFTLQRTGTLWFAIGFHAATDFAETFIYSTPDSGLLAEGHLLNSTFHGPRWLTGGTIGPEGSVFDFVLILLAFIVFAWLYPAKRADAPE